MLYLDVIGSPVECVATALKGKARGPYDKYVPARVL